MCNKFTFLIFFALIGLTIRYAHAQKNKQNDINLLKGIYHTSISDTFEALDGLRKICKYYMDARQLDSCEEYAIKGIALSKGTYHPSTAVFSNFLGEVNLRKDKMAEATAYYRKALEIYLKRNDSIQISAGYSNLALTIYGSASLTLLDSAWTFLPYNQHQSSQAFDILQNKAFILLNEKQYQPAMTVSLQAVGVAENLGLYNTAASLYLTISQIIQRLNASDADALLYAQRGLSAADKSQDSSLLSLMYQNVAIIYQRRGDYASALRYTEKAITIAEREANAPRELSDIYNNAGIIYFYLERYMEAIALTKKAMDIFIAGKDKVSEIAARGNIGEYYFMQYKKNEKAASEKTNVNASYDNLSNALNYIEQAVNECRNISNKDIALTYLQEFLPYLSDIYAAYGNTQNALETYKEYTTVNNALLNLNRTDSIAHLINSFEIQKTTDSVKTEEAIKRVELEKNIKLAALRYKYEKKQALAKTEEEKQKLMLEARTKEQQMENEAEMQRMNILSESRIAQQKLQTAALNKDKQIAQQRADLSQRRLAILSLGSLAALMLVAGGFGYARYRTRRRNEQLLADKNERIETLMQELQHRVKNNMQMISSLLSLQSRTLTDADARGAVQEGQHRIEAMSLIHHQLYLDHNITGINTKEYLEELINGLKHSFAENTKAIHFKTDIAALTIPVDTAAPLGLITNELVTNAFKYGLTDAQPVLEIKLSGSSEKMRLEIKDNGKGIQPGSSRKEGLGLKLIAALVKQLDASMTTRSDNGYSVVIQQ